MHPRHTGGVDCSSAPEQGAPAFSRLRGSAHNEANLEGAQASLQGGFGGRCAALRQIGYAWQHAAAQGRSVGMWPVSGHALPGAEALLGMQLFCTRTLPRTSANGALRVLC